MIRLLRFTDTDFAEQFRHIEQRAEEIPPGIDRVVIDILEQVRTRGDAAVVEYTRRFDNLDLEQFRHGAGAAAD